MRAFLFEALRDRRSAMAERLRDRFPFIEVMAFEAAHEMIDELQSGIADTVLLSLGDPSADDYMPVSPHRQSGSNLIAKWLATQAMPCCPVVVHTTDSQIAVSATRTLADAGWEVVELHPKDEGRWIDEWFFEARNAIVRSAPKEAPESPISILHEGLQREHFSGQGYFVETTARLLAAGRLALSKSGESVSAEVLALQEECFHAVIDSEGPIGAWAIEQGVSIAAFSELTDRGPIEAQQEFQSIAMPAGVFEFQIELLESQQMQALLAVASDRSLRDKHAQKVIRELKQAAEIAMALAERWRSNSHSIESESIDGQQVKEQPR